MNKNTGIITGVIALIIIAGGAYFSMNRTDDSKMMENKMGTPAMMEQKEPTMMKGDEAMKGGAMMNESMKVKVLSIAGSGIAGEALFVPQGEKTEVTLTLAGGAADGKYPAHIHTGACPTPGAVVYPLSPVVGGKSVTLVNASIDTLWKTLPLAVNVHKSAAEVKTYVACGDLKTATSAKADATMMKSDDKMMQAK